LFARQVIGVGSSASAQDAFHTHQWPDRPEISVFMERSDARTVSRTRVEVGPRAVTMRYEPIDGEPATISLDRALIRSGAPG